MEDAAYRDALVQIGGANPSAEGGPSAKHLDAQGLGRMLDHLSRIAGEDPLRPNADEIKADPQLAKINALLADAKRPWSYLLAKGGVGGQSLLERLTRKQRLRFCTPTDLGKVIAALQIDADRRAARGQP
jgi:hypothetical protein